MKQGGPEGQPQEQAIIERGRQELVVPQLLFGDLTTLHEAGEGIFEVIGIETRNGKDAEFIAELEEFEKRVRLSRRRGLLGQEFYLDRETMIQGEELFGRLKTEKDALPVMQTLSELKPVLQSVMEAAESVYEENRFLLRYFFPTPITDSTATDIWEAVLPRENSLEILGGLLLRSKQTVSFHAHGERHQTAESEDIKLVGPFLPPEMLAELAENVRLPAMRMNENLRRAAELVASLGKFETMEETERGKLENASHLDFDVRVFNLLLLKMLENPSRPEAGIFSILMATAFTRIKNQLGEDISEVGYGLISRIDQIIKTPHASFTGYLSQRDYVSVVPWVIDEKTSSCFPQYYAKKA